MIKNGETKAMYIDNYLRKQKREIQKKLRYIMKKKKEGTRKSSKNWIQENY